MKIRQVYDDIHSFSKPAEAIVKHLRWKAAVDFQHKEIKAEAHWEIESHAANEVVLDCKGLKIDAVLVNGIMANYQLGLKDPVLGQALHIPIVANSKEVSIYYSTTQEAEALQWLDAKQTADKKHPFLFSQSQAILARTWLPCQDSPGVRFTYEAEVTVPKDLLPLMSAANPTAKNDSGVYFFEMKQAIPAYLFALSVGDFSFQAISERCGIYAEPSVLASAVWEFADLEKMVTAAEALYGKYAWERYDVLVMPPSFPFGGMENPRLTFATPTILAGDRSLTSLIAHELAHSWSGNLVTNATWNDFWINEGFTVYFEHRIMESIYGLAYSEMLASLALQDLNATIQELTQAGKATDTHLKLDLSGRNPDEGVTDIAYNKGYFFLRSIEEQFGRELFDVFLKAYFQHFAFQSVNTEDFISFIRNFYGQEFNIHFDYTFFKDWIYSTGLPPSCPKPSADAFHEVQECLALWFNDNRISLPQSSHWNTHQWLHFLHQLPTNLTIQQLRLLDGMAQFTTSGNAEILSTWLVLAVRYGYQEAYPRLKDFLINTGRRKFLLPIYQELMKTPEGEKMAREIYQEARPNYHFVATNTFDAMLKFKLERVP